MHILVTLQAKNCRIVLHFAYKSFTKNIVFFLIFFYQDCCSQDTLNKDELNYQLLMASYYGYTDSIIYWLNLGADVDAVSSDGVSALNYAIQSRNLNAVKALVVNGANINYYSNKNLPPIFLAVSYNEKEMVNYLIAKGAKLTTLVKNKLNVLHFAVKYADSSIFRILYTNQPELFELKDDDGNSPMMAAILYKRYDIIPIICTNYNAEKHRDKFGITPFLFSIIQADSTMAEYLLHCHSQLNETSYNGYGIIEYAIISKNKDMLQWALKKESSTKKQKSSVKLAYIAENRQLARIFQITGYPNYYGFVFSKLNIGHSHIFTSNDYMFGFTSKLTEYRYGFLSCLNFYTRLWANRVMFPTDENNVYIQAWERRSLLNFQFSKHILLYGNSKNKLYFLAGFASYYTYGKFRGIEEKPKAYFLHTPSLFLLWQTPDIALSVGFEHFKFKNIDAKGLHITLSQTFTIPLHNLYIPNKHIAW